MIDEYKERIDNAKDRPYLALKMFNIGDIVYPFFSPNLVNWGTVVDVNPVTRKVMVNFNGVNRQFDPEWLIKTNPELKTASLSKNKIAFNYQRTVEAIYYKEAPSIYKVSENEEENGEMTCPKCKSVFEISYDPETKETVLVCPKCGKRITKSKIASVIKISSKVGDLLISFEEFAEKIKKDGNINKDEIISKYSKQFPEYGKLIKEYSKDFLKDIMDELKKKGIKII